MNRIKLLDHANRRVIEVRRGDVVRMNDAFMLVDGFYKNERGVMCVRVGFPESPQALQTWAKRNPHRVKDLRLGRQVKQEVSDGMAKHDGRI